MKEWFKIILPFFLGVFGSNGIFYLMFRNHYDKINEQQKQENEIKKELLKSKLEQKNYISKTRFEAEFEIYHLLSESILKLVAKSTILFTRNFMSNMPKEKNERTKYIMYFFNEAHEAYDDAFDVINKNAPFIPEKFYDICDEIKMDCFNQIEKFHSFIYSSIIDEVINGTNDEYKDSFDKAPIIAVKLNNLIKDLRKYLEDLDVTE